MFLPLLYAIAGQTIIGNPGVVPGVDDLVKLIEPALRTSAQSKARRSAQPLVSLADQQGIRDALALKGVSGGALDLMTRLLTLTASLVVADARR